jgi:hypothetical protein
VRALGREEYLVLDDLLGWRDLVGNSPMGWPDIPEVM